MAKETAEMYEKYNGIQYNKESVQQAMEAYRAAHPHAKANELNRARDMRVVKQVVTEIRTRLLESEAENDPEKKGALPIAKMKMAATVENNLLPEIAFFSTFKENEVAEQLKKFQATFGQMTNLDRYKAEMERNYSLCLNLNGRKRAETAENTYGKAYFKGLFLPKTDGADLVQAFDDYIPAAEAPLFGVDNESVAKYQAKAEKRNQMIKSVADAQKAIDETEIKVPENVNLKEALIPFVVMGELFTEANGNHILNNSNGAEKPYQTDYTSARNSLQMLVFTDLFKGDFRGDIPLTLQTVANSRKAVNEKLQNNPEAIRENLKNAFQTFLTDCMDEKNMKEPEWQFEAKSLKALLNLTENTPYAFELTPVEKEKVKLISQKAELVADTKVMEEQSAEIMTEFIKSEGNDPAKDPLKNPKLFHHLLNTDICNTILTEMKVQNSGYIGDVVNNLPKEQKDKALCDRPLTDIEKKYVNQEQALEDEIKDRLLHSEKMQSILKAKTFHDKVKAIGSLAGLGTVPKEVDCLYDEATVIAQSDRMRKMKETASTTLSENEIGEFITDFESFYDEKKLDYFGVWQAANQLKDSFDVLRESNGEPNGVDISAAYNSFVSQAESLLQNHKDTSTQFVVGNFLHTLKSDKDLLAPEADGLVNGDFSAADIMGARENAPGYDGSLAGRTFEKRTTPKETAAMKQEFQAMLDKMEKVSTRFGGNSKEFSQMLKDAKAFAKGPASPEQLALLAEKLENSTDAYIKAKGRIPSTEKGRERLALARQMRNFCRENTMKLQRGGLAEGVDYVNYLKSATVNTNINLRIKNCMDEMKHANTSRNKPLFAAKLAEMMYVEKIGTRLAKKEIDKEKAEQLLLPANINKSVKKTLPFAAAVYEKTDKAELAALFAEKDGAEKVTALFNNQVKAAELQKNNPNAVL